MELFYIWVMALERKKIFPEDEKGEIRITGVPGKVINEIGNIARKIGTPPQSFLKVKLNDIVNSYPEDYRSYSPDGMDGEGD